MADETGDIDADRAAGNAGRVLALDAALDLLKRLRRRIAEVDFLEVACALVRVPFGHLRLMRHQLGQLLVAALFVLEELFFEVTDVRVALVGPRFLALEALLTRDQLGEVDLVAVEIGALDAGELDLAGDGHAA